MTIKKIESIEKKIKNTSDIDTKIKEDLLDLMRSLKTELKDVKGTHPEKAHNIADKTQISTEKTLDTKADIADLDGLQKAVGEFEVSHPKLVQLVNRLCIMLSDIGI